MKAMKPLVLCCLLLFQTAVSAQTFSSGENTVQLLELYTSEGCSSCPPADNWLSKFKTSGALWTNFIPVAFHVDYWNYLGWKDRYALPANSRRQYAYKNSGNLKSVYTPGFVLNGYEWRGWYRQQAVPVTSDSEGVLTVTLDGSNLSASYGPLYGADKQKTSLLLLNVALLGFGLKTDIRAGENKGKVLQHDFVVLSHETIKSSERQWKFKLPSIQPMPGALAAWVTRLDDKAILQATGGWLER